LDQGFFTPEMDLLISSTASVHELTLVTHNVHVFAHVHGLDVVDWLARWHRRPGCGPAGSPGHNGVA
jgi:hypothetical protein